MSSLSPKKFGKILADSLCTHFPGIDISYEEQSYHGDAITTITCPSEQTADLLMESFTQHLGLLVQPNHLEELDSVQSILQKLNPEMQVYGREITNIEGSILVENPKLYRSHPAIEPTFRNAESRLRESPETFAELEAERRSKIPHLIILNGGLIGRLLVADRTPLTEPYAQEKCEQFAEATAETYSAISSSRFLGSAGKDGYSIG